MPARDRARELLAEILTRSEFAGAEEGLLHRLASLIKAKVPGFISGPGLVATLVISFAAVGAFLGLLVWVMRRLSLPAGGEEGGAALRGGQGTPRAALAASQEAAGQGSYKEALRLLLLALLLQLDGEGALDYHYSRTNGEYLKELGQRGFPARIPAAELFSLYEKVWYGRSRCLREDYDRGLKLYSVVREEGR